MRNERWLPSLATIVRVGFLVAVGIRGDTSPRIPTATRNPTRTMVARLGSQRSLRICHDKTNDLNRLVKNPDKRGPRHAETSPYGGAVGILCSADRVLHGPITIGSSSKRGEPSSAARRLPRFRF